ncbi:MAG: LysR family transcriptional regulator [Burkholderiales bacterium]
MKKRNTELHDLERADLRLALAIYEAGSLSGASRLLEMEPPAVSKKLARLEQCLGFVLFHRNTRRLQLSGDAEPFFQQAKEVLLSFDKLTDQLLDKQSALRGKLRLCSSFGFGRHVLAPLLAEFQLAHPLVQVQLQLVDHLPDLLAGGWDAAVWLWSPKQMALRVQILARNHRILVAAPSYLQRNGRPHQPQDLASHQCLVVRENDAHPAIWSLQTLPKSQRTRNLQTVEVQIQGPLSSNSGEVVRDWALAGHGIMLRSMWDVHTALQRGDLVHPLAAPVNRDERFTAVAPRIFSLSSSLLGRLNFQHTWFSKLRLRTTAHQSPIRIKAA